MGARQRAEERDFNRRRHMLLSKGFEMCHNQLETAFGDCLLNLNVKEGDKLATQVRTIDRQAEIESGHKKQERRHFIIVRNIHTLEPSLLLEREPSAKTLGQDPTSIKGRPRFMQQLKTRKQDPANFQTIALFRPERRKKLNLWELSGMDVVHSDDIEPTAVKFRASVSPVRPLTTEERGEARREWSYLHRLQSRDSVKDRANASRTTHRTTGTPISETAQIAYPELPKLTDRSSESDYSDTASSLTQSSSRDQNIFVTQWVPVKDRQQEATKPSLSSHPTTLTQSFLRLGGGTPAPLRLRNVNFHLDEGNTSKEFIHLSTICRSQESIGVLQEVIKGKRPKSKVLQLQ